MILYFRRCQRRRRPVWTADRPMPSRTVRFRMSVSPANVGPKGYNSSRKFTLYETVTLERTVHAFVLFWRCQRLLTDAARVGRRIYCGCVDEVRI